MNKEKWIDDILQSAKGIGPVAADPYMATRIMAKTQQDVPVIQLPVKWVYVSAAALLLLVMINVAVWQSTVRPQQSSPAVQQLIQEYGWSNGDLYSVNFSKPAHE